MSKDWTGNGNSIFKTLGASSHTDADRQAEDYYATDPKAVDMLLDMEQFNRDIWEPACGEGHMTNVLEARGHNVRCTDLIDRGVGTGGVDFLGIDNMEWHGDIITNPPYKYSLEFVEKALSIIPTGNKVAMFLKIQFLESQGRKHFLRTFPPKTVYVASNRIECAINGDFRGTSAVCYAWYVWEKGFKGTTELKWFN
jgi:hypothetical protein